VKHIKWLAAILFGALVIIVISQNIPNLKASVFFSINLWPFERYQTPNIPLGFIAVITFLIGVLSMAVCGITERFRLKKQIKTLLGEAREREKELNSLRNSPVTTEFIDTEQTYDTE
jgi:uncharacterized integral membrane protein